MTGSRNDREVVRFYALTFVLTWALAFAIPLLHLSEGVGLLVFLIGVAGPSIVAFALSFLEGGLPRVRALLSRIVRWRVGWRWWLAAIALPLTASFIARALGAAYHHESMTEALTRHAYSWWSLRVLQPVAFLYVLRGGAFLEEFGWRGYALPRLLATGRRPIDAALLNGVVWALWHLPVYAFPTLFPYGNVTILDFPFFALGIVAFSVWQTWVFINARGSQLVGGNVVHILVNAGPEEPWWPSLGVASAIVAAVVALFGRSLYTPVLDDDVLRLDAPARARVTPGAVIART
jgi:membrane protease YdiL (CAAX protease family)